MSKLLAIIAAILPTSVLFQIHQVVVAFQINRAIKQCKKNVFLFVTVSATNNNGTNPKNSKQVKEEVGQAAHKIRPEHILITKD